MAEETVHLRLWCNGSPKEWHRVSPGFHDRLLAYIAAHPKVDIIIEYRDPHRALWPPVHTWRR